MYIMQEIGPFTPGQTLTFEAPYNNYKCVKIGIQQPHSKSIVHGKGNIEQYTLDNDISKTTRFRINTGQQKNYYINECDILEFDDYSLDSITITPLGSSNPYTIIDVAFAENE